MGGNAFEKQGITLTRMPTKNYLANLKYIKNLCSNYIHIKIPQHIRDKKDHGDIDIIYYPKEPEFSEKFKNHEDFINNFVKVHFESDISDSHNSERGPHMLHFNKKEADNDFQEAQVDFMLASSLKNLEYQYFYMSHSDFGSILGQICSQLGYTLTISDLRIKIYYDNDPSKICSQMVLTESPREICKFLDYDYDELMKGFDSKIDFFDFMLSSKYVQAKFFDTTESFNYTHRKRATKRPTYMQFMDYVKDQYENHGKFQEEERLRNLAEMESYSVDEIQNYRAKNKRVAAKYFGKLDEYDQKLADFEKMLLLKEKFSAKTVLKYIPIFEKKITENKKNGRILGEFVIVFKKKWSEEWLLTASEDEIRHQVVFLWHDFKGTVEWIPGKT